MGLQHDCADVRRPGSFGDGTVTVEELTFNSHANEGECNCCYCAASHGQFAR